MKLQIEMLRIYTYIYIYRNIPYGWTLGWWRPLLTRGWPRPWFWRHYLLLLLL